MWLKEVVVDGFKSYAQRTVIGRFDAAFTAITGLNGTGKSNILDAICFVLGITNLQQVRASSLSELVYKAGQAGVTAASVSLLFDNSDVQRSPVGYAEYAELTVTRVVVLGGKSRYLINGATAQLQRVLNLFHSVGLNVNNPHFLIMQGRITRVIGMRPAELLGLIEEAAGTRMFEAKKEAAVRTIGRKQTKVDEITAILQQEIAPQLSQLREEQEQLAQFTNKRARLAQLERLHHAHAFVLQQRAIDAGLQQAQQQRALCGEREAAVQRLDEELQRHAEQAEALEAELKAGRRGGAAAASAVDFDALEAAVTRRSKALVLATTEHGHAREAVEAEEAAVARLSAQAQRCEAEESDARGKMDAAAVRVREAEEALHSAQAELAECRSRELGVGLLDAEQAQRSRGKKTARSAERSADMVEDDGSGSGGLHGQLMARQRLLSQLHGQLDLVRLQLRDLNGNVEDATAASSRRPAKDVAEHARLRSAIAQQQRSIDGLTQLIESLSRTVDASARGATEVRLSALQDDAAAVRRQLTELRARLSRFDFSYDSPSATFARSSVKGTVVSQLTLLRAEAARAVETAAGGRLLNVIVDNEHVGKALLERGALTRRWTMIPLSAISTAATIPPAVQRRAAEEVGEDAARLALDCVGFDGAVRPAMQFVFGSTFVCPTTAAASRLTFHPDIARRTATFDGDILDPRGTMEGGSSANQVSVLAQFEQARSLQQRLGDFEAEAAAQQAALDALDADAVRLKALSTERDALQHELALLHTRAANSAIAQADQRVSDWTAAAQRLREEELRLNAEQQRVGAQCAAMEAELASMDTEAGRAASRAALQQRMAALQSSLIPLRSALSACAHELTVLFAQLELLSAERQSTCAALESARSSVERLQAARDEAARTVKGAKADWDAAQAALSEAQATLATQSAALTTLLAARARLQQRRKDAELECRRLQAAEHKAQQALQDGRRRLERLRAEHPWIAAEEPNFGRAGGEFDFDSAAAAAASPASAFAALQAEVAALGARVNRKAVGLSEKAERDYLELSAKRDIIEADKRKIEQVIAELERKKRRAVEDTWRKVNGDFGAIMASLLPGVHAALQPVNAQQVQDGVEMRVAFAGVWKDSLSELSGGQRSLLALSFILSLLLFNPAPMYVLDEIDSALDLAHTQNIGRMLKRHFPQSQFIVVSLKEGMFNNANVLFRTSFVNGVSAVTRTQADANANGHKEGHEQQAHGKKRQQRKRLAEGPRERDEMGKENVMNS